jgi:hypothetical protein
MRTAILNYLQDHSADLSPLTISTNLPWEDNGAALAHHNKKHVYVDLDQVQQTPVLDALNAAGLVDETTTVRVYFVTDAKKPLTNLETLIDTVKGARLTANIAGVTQRLCQVTNTFNNDAIETEFEFSFRKIITN